MKRIVSFILIILLLFSSACAADKFLDNYNFYAESVYGIQQIRFDKKDSSYTQYVSDTVYVCIWTDGSISVISKNHLDAISAACCVLRCIDNKGNRIDQYGRILHAYYLSMSASGEMKTAVTENKISITVNTNHDLLYIWVK